MHLQDYQKLFVHNMSISILSDFVSFYSSLQMLAVADQTMAWLALKNPSSVIPSKRYKGSDLICISRYWPIL